MEPQQREHRRPSTLAALMGYLLAALAGAVLAAGTASAQGYGAEFDGRFRGPARPGMLDVIRTAPGLAPAPAPGRTLVPGPMEALNHEDDLYRDDPIPWDGSGVKRLAHELEDASRQLYSNYRQRSDTGNWIHKQSRRAAIEALKDLVAAAEHFHQQVESRAQDPQHTREDFRRVLMSLDRVDRVLPGAYRSDRVRSEYHRMTQLAESMLRYYRSRRGGGGWRDWATVKGLAHVVDEKARHAYEQALKDWHHGSYWEQRAISDLREFSSKASHFHGQVENGRDRDASHTRQDYWNLVSAFRRAHDSLRRAHPTEHVLRDFQEAARALRELDRYYRDRDGRDGGHGRPGRGPWDDPDHGDDDHHRDPEDDPDHDDGHHRSPRRPSWP